MPFDTSGDMRRMEQTRTGVVWAGTPYAAPIQQVDNLKTILNPHSSPETHSVYVQYPFVDPNTPPEQRPHLSCYYTPTFQSQLPVLDFDPQTLLRPAIWD